MSHIMPDPATSARTRLERCCGQPTPPELIADLDEDRADTRTKARVEAMQEAADWLMSQGHTIAARALDGYIEGKADRPSGPERIRKIGYLAAQPHSGRFLIEYFVADGDDFAPEPADLAETAAELTAAIIRHFEYLGGAR